MDDLIKHIDDNAFVAHVAASNPEIRKIAETDHVCCGGGVVCDALCRKHADVGGEG